MELLTTSQWSSTMLSLFTMQPMQSMLPLFTMQSMLPPTMSPPPYHIYLHPWIPPFPQPLGGDTSPL